MAVGVAQNRSCMFVIFDEKEGRHEIWSYFICDLLTGKHVSYHPLINFLQHNVVVDVIALAY